MLTTYTCFQNTHTAQRDGKHVVIECGGEVSYKIFTKANREEGLIDEAKMGVW